MPSSSFNVPVLAKDREGFGTNVAVASMVAEASSSSGGVPPPLLGVESMSGSLAAVTWAVLIIAEPVEFTTTL